MAMEDLGSDEGLDNFEELTNIALIDADTIVYASAVSNEYPDEVLHESMYTKSEWLEIINNPNYDSLECCIWKIDHELAMADSRNRVADIMLATASGSAELFFTVGLNFRHTVDPQYKANRKSTRPPVGLRKLKTELAKEYKGSMVCEGFEADDIIVALKKSKPEYVLCAVDKDVYKSVAGKHWNYYYSAKYSISPKWVVTTEESAMKFPYLQTLMGDATDNIKGCPSIGPKKAERALANCDSEFEMWQVVVELFDIHSGGLIEAVMNMRLVNMHQLERCDEEPSGWCWNPWSQPTVGGE